MAMDRTRTVEEESSEEVEEFDSSDIDTLNSSDSLIPIVNNNNNNARKEVLVEVCVDENLEEYRKLKNSEYISESIFLERADMGRSVKINNYANSRMKENYPGVFACTFYDHNNAVIGYIRINPKTIKPYERISNMSVVFTVIKGTVVLKSTTYKEIAGKKYLEKIVVTRGTAIAVPEGHPCTFENRTDDDVVIQYVVIR